MGRSEVTLVDGEACFACGDFSIDPENASDQAEEALGELVSRSVITVPAYFNDATPGHQTGGAEQAGWRLSVL